MKHLIGKTGAFAFAVIAAACGVFAAPAFAANAPLIVGQVGNAPSPLESTDDEPVKYESSNSKIVSVTKVGKIKAKKSGVATVIARQGKTEVRTSYKVYAQDKTKTNKPATVTSLLAKQTGDTSVMLSWSKVKQSDGYIVYHRIEGTYIPIKVVAGAATTSFSVDGLDTNIVQNFAVSSYRNVSAKIATGTKKAKTVKRLAVSSKSPYAAVLIANAESTTANAGSITFDRNEVTIIRKGTASIMAQLNSSVEGLPVCDDKIRYTTSNSEVATVDSSGMVSSHTKTAATCTLTAFAHNGVKAKISVRILPRLTKDDAVFVAHRGDSSVAPENTTASAIMAALNGYERMEFDVWETFSGDLVVLHNQNMKQMYGVDKDIRELVTGDIASPNYYGNFKVAVDKNLEQYKGLTVPTFEEIIRLASAFNIKVTIHAKNSGNDPLTEQGVQKMVSVLNLYEMKGKASIASQDAGTIASLKTQTDYPLQYILQTTSGFDITGPNYLSELKAGIDYAASQDCECISIRYRQGAPFNASLIGYAHKKGLKVSTWDVTSNKKVCTMIDMGVDSITLDKKLFE